MSAFELVDRGANVGLVGRLAIDEGKDLCSSLEREIDRREGSVTIELEALEELDGACAALLSSFVVRHPAVRLEGARPGVAALLELYQLSPGEGLKDCPKRISTLDQIGRFAADMVRTTRTALEFGGELVVALLQAIRQPSSVNWGELARLMERAGADGVPIVVLLNFLVGLIIGLQTAEQLARFGASVFMADGVGLAMTRELAPLMTAIIVAGRSGAAFAAELGTMKVSEEIDALRTLGLDPQRYLVFPRILALALVVPLLTLLADVVGCLGGWVISVAELGISSTLYFSRLHDAVGLSDLLGGLIKSVAFAVAIGLISCQRGLATRGGAEGVGASTTAAVVTILFNLVVLDAVFTVIFNLFGI